MKKFMNGGAPVCTPFGRHADAVVAMYSESGNRICFTAVDRRMLRPATDEEIENRCPKKLMRYHDDRAAIVLHIGKVVRLRRTFSHVFQGSPFLTVTGISDPRPMGVGKIS